MSQIAYSDERREAFQAFRLLHGADAALDRCDIDAARRWFLEEKAEGVARRLLVMLYFICLAIIFGCALGVDSELLQCMGVIFALIALLGRLFCLGVICSCDFESLSDTNREDILSHFFLSDAELDEAEAREAEIKAMEDEDERREREQAETVLARFNDTVSAEGFGDRREDE